MFKALPSFLCLLLSLVSAEKILQAGEGCGKPPRCEYDYWPDAKSKANTSSGKAICSNSQYQTICAEVDKGSYEFNFTKNGTFAYQSFTLTPLTPVSIAVWDCFCSGDSFEIYDNDVLLLSVSGNGDTDCNALSDYPLQCLYDENNWASSLSPVPLAPGIPHTITIRVTASPYDSGTGFISFVSACDAIFTQKRQDDSNYLPCCILSSSCSFNRILNQQHHGTCHRD